ncbi:hypothetical protein AMAG_15408 [Allomyces macrogynus ATCC 38327]|uniref:Uncharacterized protein n=1 Tax=Allomyces macrogynus (strain ATCC 38327) TaxID=578462 RepID=A0A0L0T7H8_ALLM3|nr:hypothetical protein AMAG_15408 [Allomyces macrogynus ATCC 38327]|eukprot:KNE70651.1 hypothetical protein AMAG_15408 [Allomyces macrogynus ATCC 38327]
MLVDSETRTHSHLLKVSRGVVRRVPKMPTARQVPADDELDLDRQSAAVDVKQAFQAMTAALREYDREVDLARDRDLARARRRPTAPVVPPSSSPPPAAAAVWDLDEYMMRVVDPVDEEDEEDKEEALPLRAATRLTVIGARPPPAPAPARVLLPVPAGPPSGPSKPALRSGKVNIAPLVGKRGAGGVGKGAKAVKVKGQRTLDV